MLGMLVRDLTLALRQKRRQQHTAGHSVFLQLQKASDASQIFPRAPSCSTESTVSFCVLMGETQKVFRSRPLPRELTRFICKGSGYVECICKERGS